MIAKIEFQDMNPENPGESITYQGYVVLGQGAIQGTNVFLKNGKIMLVDLYQCRWLHIWPDSTEAGWSSEPGMATVREKNNG